MKPAIILKEAPHLKSMFEKEMRYEVVLNGTKFGDLSFNMTGYIGYLPTPNGHGLDIGERSISQFRKEIRNLNREFAAKTQELGR